MTRKMSVLACGLLACAVASAASPTATLLKNRASYNADIATAVKQGKWVANFAKAKKYATDNRVPLVAVWSNGDSCGHCTTFEGAVNSSTFRNYMKSSGVVFYFVYSGDKGNGTTSKSGSKADNGAVASPIFHWCRKNTQTAYPFVRVYWPGGGVDISTVGDSIDKKKSGTTGGKYCVDYFKAKLKKFKPFPTVSVPYTVVFDPNGGTGEMPEQAATSDVSLTLPANAFTYPDYAFAGWAKTADGAVAYKDKAAVGSLTTVSNDIVTLYAKWTRTIYRDNEAGVKATIEMPDCKGWSVISGAVTGMKWSSSTGKWTGTPTVAMTYTVKYKKGSSTKTRKIVVVPGAPYSIAFAPNGATNEMESVDLQYGVARALPANAFVRPDCSFAGWAKTATGAVAYKNNVSVRNLTSVSNKVVTLYAKWTRTTYRTYFTGVKATIAISDCKGWATKSGAVPGMSWNASTGKWTGTPKTAGTYTTAYKKGKSTRTRKIVVVKDAVVFADEDATRYVAAEGERFGLNLAPATLAGAAKSVSFSGLPAGLSYDAATGYVTGTPERVGTFKVTVTVVSANGQKLTRTFNVTIGVSNCCIGTFNGFIGWSDPDASDPLYLDNRGTFRMYAPSNANLSAKIVTAKGTYSLTGQGWFVNDDGTYTANLTAANGTDELTFTVSSNAVMDAYLSYGTFKPSYGTEYEIWAQRSIFGRDESGEYRDPLAAATAGKIVGEWGFKTTHDDSYGYDLWKLRFVQPDDADMTLKIDEDGTVQLAGMIGSHAVSASSAVFLFEDDVTAGFARVGFAIPVEAASGGNVLQIKIRLWFDRGNGDPRNSDSERFVGNAYLEVFE